MYGYKTVLLLGLLTGIFLIVGEMTGGITGMIIAFIIAIITDFFSYWFSDKLALAMYGAQEIPYEEAPWLHNMVRDLAKKAGIPKPKIYLAPIDVPNAFATGRNPNHAAIAVTSGILQILDPEELKGVIAHELAHIKNWDILISSIVAVISSAILFLVRMLSHLWVLNRSSDRDRGIGGIIESVLLIFFIPIVTLLVQMAISRTREFDADATGAKVCGCPLSLARALEKLEMAAEELAPVASEEIKSGTAHMMIVNPLRTDFIDKLFSTHPTTEERIRRLKELAAEMGKF